MTDYRYVMGLLLQGLAYRQIEAMAGCSHRAIARARRVLDDERLTTAEQVEGLTAEDLDRLFTDGRKSVVAEFVAVDIETVVASRLTRKKPPLKVLWAMYLRSDAAPGATAISRTPPDHSAGAGTATRSPRPRYHFLTQPLPTTPAKHPYY